MKSNRSLPHHCPLCPILLNILDINENSLYNDKMKTIIDKIKELKNKYTDLKDKNSLLVKQAQSMRSCCNCKLSNKCENNCGCGICDDYEYDDKLLLT